MYTEWNCSLCITARIVLLLYFIGVINKSFNFSTLIFHLQIKYNDDTGTEPQIQVT